MLSDKAAMLLEPGRWLSLHLVLQIESVPLASLHGPLCQGFVSPVVNLALRIETSVRRVGRLGVAVRG